MSAAPDPTTLRPGPVSNPSAQRQPATLAPLGRQAFALQPFGNGVVELAGIRIEGWLQRQESHLNLSFELHGPDRDDPSSRDQSILWPPAGGDPVRRDGLWQHTCLEWFIARRGEAAYWEFNLAPNGDWNVYTLADYRQGLRADPHYGALPLLTFSDEQGGNDFRVRAPLPAALAAAQPGALELAVTTVVEQRNGALSYWALHHGGAEADFHRRDGFRLRI